MKSFFFVVRLATTVTLAERENLKLVRFHLWFSTAVCRWLDIAVYKAMMRIGRAVACDAFVPVDPLAKHSSSAVDTVTVFYQVEPLFKSPLPRSFFFTFSIHLFSQRTSTSFGW